MKANLKQKKISNSTIKILFYKKTKEFLLKFNSKISIKNIIKYSINTYK